MCHMYGSADCACETTASTDHAHEHTHSHEHTPTRGDAQEHTHVHAPASVSADYGVQGMTCSHCVSSVSEELSRVAGVKNVDIELVAGGISRVTVDSDRALDEGEVAAAIDEAGYDLVGLPR